MKTSTTPMPVPARATTPAPSANGAHIKPEPPKFDELLGLLNAYASGAIFVPGMPSYYRGAQRFEKFSTLALFRDGKYQIELFIVDPDATLMDMQNPFVDSVVSYVTGEILFRVNGKPAPIGSPHELENGLCSVNGAWFRVRPRESFGCSATKVGGAFLLFSMRTDGKAWKDIDGSTPT